MIAVEEVVEKIQKSADQSSQEVRHISKIEIGKAIRQGDVYLIRIKDDLDHGEKMESSQLVAGSSSGSRHMAEKPAVVYKNTTRPVDISNEAIIGPVVKSEGRFILSHPEHAHFSLPAGTYQCIQQLDERTKKAVID